MDRRGIVEFLLTEKKDETQWKVLFKNPSDGLQVKLVGGVSGTLKREPDKRLDNKIQRARRADYWQRGTDAASSLHNKRARTVG